MVKKRDKKHVLIAFDPEIHLRLRQASWYRGTPMVGLVREATLAAIEIIEEERDEELKQKAAVAKQMAAS